MTTAQRNNDVRLMLAMGALLAGAAAGCASQADPSGEVEGPAPAAAAASPSRVALAIEQAERKLDTGKDVAGARAALEATAKDPEATPEQKDQATLALSRAIELGGDKEGAIATIESLLALRGGDQHWAAEEVVEQRLYKLLTGKDELPQKHEDDRPVEPFTRHLAKYFPDEPGRALDVNILLFGGDDDHGRNETFDVGRAIKQARREALTPRDDKVSIRTMESRMNWLAIPKSRAQFANALVVFYFDLDADKIPARYDADLPIPSADVIAHLEKGEGLVAARERAGAPPVILIAAPRAALLPEVEGALAKMNELPLEPTPIKLDTGLGKREIQSVVRGGFGEYRQCYEDLLKRAPGAAGKLLFKLSVKPDGTVADAAIDPKSTLTEPVFDQCMETSGKALVFPKTDRPTNIVYPIELSP